MENTLPWPTGDLFSSVNESSVVPEIDIVYVNSHFLKSYKNEMGMSQYEAVHRKGYNMMNAEFLIALIEAKIGSNNFYKGQVNSELTKSLTYFVHIVVADSGYIVQSTCECVAGKGVKAVCKHIAVVCYAILKFKESGIWPLRKTITQKKQQWHLPKKTRIVGSPKKAEDISFNIPLHNVNKRMKHSLCYDPRPRKAINNPSFNDNVRNMVINYCNSTKKTLGISGIFEVANMSAIVNDHDYLKLPLHYQLIMNKIQVSASEAADIEKKTRKQAQSTLWFNERKFRITASKIGEICHFTEKKDKKKYAENLISPVVLNTLPILWGKSKELQAKEAYTAVTSNIIQPCGLFISTKEPFIAASPDGLICRETVLEIKCPYSIRNDKISPTNYTHIEYVDNQICLKKNSNYYFQVQTQMYVTQRRYCDFLVWTTCDSLLVSICRDDEFIGNEIIPVIRNFYNEYMIPAISKKLYKT